MAFIEKPIWSEDGNTLTNVLVNDILVTYNRTDLWYDGTPLDDSKLDSDLVYVKYEGKYLVRNFEYGQVLQKDTMQEMRDLSSYEILLLKMGVYKHVQLNGYYEKGDTPSPINYTLSDTEDEDDGGSVVVVEGVKLEHIFERDINLRYFGAYLNYDRTSKSGSDDYEFWVKSLNYQNKNRELRIVFKGYSYISSTLSLFSESKIVGGGVLNSGIYSGFEGANVIEYLNGYVVEDGEVKEWGSQCQPELRNFSIGSSIDKPVDEFGRNLEFLDSTAVHLEGCRYRGNISSLRVVSPFKVGIYLFGSWGIKMNSIDILRGAIGIKLDSGSNGVTLEKILTQRVSNINDVSNTGAIILTGNGDAENQRGNGYNVVIKDSIFERGYGSPAVKAYNITNLCLDNVYIERQTSNQRSIILHGCKRVYVNNVNVENSLGVMIDGCDNVAINNFSLYTTMGDYNEDRAVALTGDNNEVVIHNSTYEGKKLNIPYNSRVGMLILTEEQANNLEFRPNNTHYNYFIDPIFTKRSSFSASPLVSSEYISSGLKLIFPKTNSYDFASYTTGGYVSKGEGFCNLIVHVNIKGRGIKRLTMTRSSGSAVVRDVELEGDAFILIRTSANSTGVAHNFRIGVMQDNEEEVEIIVRGVYLGEHNYSSLLDEPDRVVGNIQDSQASDLAELVNDFNGLLQALKDSKIMGS